jgi:hypothetical protein
MDCRSDADLLINVQGDRRITMAAQSRDDGKVLLGSKEIRRNRVM